MENVTNELQVRIAWCQLQRTRAVTLDEEEDWRAEESGLLDAFTVSIGQSAGETLTPPGSSGIKSASWTGWPCRGGQALAPGQQQPT